MMPLKWLLLVLLLTAIVLLAALLAWPKLFPAPVAQLYPDPVPELPFETLQENDAEQLESITVSHAGGESYTLVYRAGTLLLEKDDALLDINDSLCADFLESAATIAVENVVTRDGSEVAEHLDEMGLDEPRITVGIRYTDGRENRLYIGGSVPNTTYSYFRWSGDGGVYMCDAGIGELFGHTANQLLPVTQPNLTPALVDRLSISNEAGEMALTLKRNAAGDTAGQMLLPVRYPMDGAAAAALYTSLENFRLGTLLGDAASQAEALGFDAPACILDIHQQEGRYTRINDAGELVVETSPAMQLRFVFGRAEGEYFYTCAYEGQAYLVSRFLVESMVSAAPEALRTSHPAELGGWPARIGVETGSGSLTVEIRQELRMQENGEPELNEDEEWIYDTIATLNGEVLPAAKAETLVQRLRSLSFSGSLPAGWTAEGLSPRWKMTLTGQDGDSRTLTAYRLDAFSDAVAVDGVALHYCYVEALEAALGELMP
jgi:hypothetical protein